MLPGVELHRSWFHNPLNTKSGQIIPYSLSVYHTPPISLSFRTACIYHTITMPL